MDLYYLFAGLLSLLLSAAHSAWGEGNILGELRRSDLSKISKLGLFISWYQTSVVLLVLGAGLMFNAYHEIFFVSFILLLIVAASFLTYLIVGFVMGKKILFKTIPHSFTYVLIILLIVIGLLR